jgi:hypothetical protein
MRGNHFAPIPLVFGLFAISALATQDASAQSITACYVPASGTVYVIGLPGAPGRCHSDAHVEFSWSATPVIDGLSFHFGGGPLPASGQFRAVCASGKTLINFGWEPTPFPLAGALAGDVTQIRKDRPAISGQYVGWLFEGEPGTGWLFYWSCANSNPIVTN